MKYYKPVKSSCSSLFLSLPEQSWFAEQEGTISSYNFLLRMPIYASSQGNSKFTEFICLHGADSISQKSPKFYLLTHYFTYSPKFFLPIRCFAHSPKFSTTKVFHYTVDTFGEYQTFCLFSLYWWQLTDIISQAFF